MGGGSVLAMLVVTGGVVLSMIALVVRFDPAAKALEWRVRRGTAGLLREAERATRAARP